VAGPSADVSLDDRAVVPGREAAALADAISRAWQPYRWRAYVAGIVVGILIGGVPAAIATTMLALIVALAGIEIDPMLPWAEILWTAAFVLAFAASGAWALARWLPQPFKAATETYLWLADQAETHWREQFGVPVPRTPASMRAFLAATPATSETAGERYGIYMGLGDLTGARREIEAMPAATPVERHQVAAATWLADLAAGGDPSLEPLRAAAEAITDPAERREADVEVALSESRLALAQGRDWMAPAAAIRDRLGSEPDPLMWRLAGVPAFRSMLAAGTVGVAAYWLILGPR
jgi:hypothetical protein